MQFYTFRGIDFFYRIIILFTKGIFTVNWKKYLKYLCCGAIIGGADIIPGVSGGTMAFILGIYNEMLEALKSWLSWSTVKALFTADWKTLKSKPFALPFWVVLGIAAAIVLLSSPIKYALDNHPQYLWAFFFGLVAASVFSVRKKIDKWDWKLILVLLGGGIGAYYLTGMVPTETPEHKLFIVFCGALAISAMILPGISGSFVLLLIGKYDYILGAVNGLKSGVLSGNGTLALESLVILLCFGIGVIAGLVSFVRLLSFCLKKYYSWTIAILIGFMLGSLRKVWPFKDGEVNILPRDCSWETVLTILLAAVGFVMVIFIERFAEKIAEKNENIEKGE